MAEPVIARRCHACGASIREAVLFCPQCGNELPQRDSGQPSPPVKPEATISEHGTTLGDTLGDTASEARKDASVNFSKKSQKKLKQRSQKETAVNPPAAAPGTSGPANEAAKSPVGQVKRGRVGAKIQRATTLARDVEGDVIHRARKVREISSVVLDEAGDDPSLRFVLVAAALFLLFVIIVVLNKVIG